MRLFGGDKVCENGNVWQSECIRVRASEAMRVRMRENECECE